MLYFVECLSFIDNVYRSIRFKNQGESFCGTIHVKANLQLTRPWLYLLSK